MGWFFGDKSDESRAHAEVSSLCPVLPSITAKDAPISQYHEAPHKAKLSHELIAGAASYEVGCPEMIFPVQQLITY
jgi:hypothetical protein